jgi:hypothetical protein
MLPACILRALLFNNMCFCSRAVATAALHIFNPLSLPILPCSRTPARSPTFAHCWLPRYCSSHHLHIAESSHMIVLWPFSFPAGSPTATWCSAQTGRSWCPT